MLDFCWGFVDSAPLFCPLPSDSWSRKQWIDDENCNQQLSKYAGHFSFLFSLKRWRCKFANSFFFFPKQQKQNYLLRNVWSCQNPAEQPPTSGIQTVANMGSKKSIFPLFSADKVMLLEDQSDVRGFSLMIRILIMVQMSCLMLLKSQRSTRCCLK